MSCSRIEKHHCRNIVPWLRSSLHWSTSLPALRCCDLRIPCLNTLGWHAECRTSCLKDVAFLWFTIVSASSTAHLCISYCMQPEIRLSSCQVYCFLSSLRVGLRCWVRFPSMQVEVSAVFAMARYCIPGFLILRLHVLSRVGANSITWHTKLFAHRHRQGDCDSDMGN